MRLVGEMHVAVLSDSKDWAMALGRDRLNGLGGVGGRDRCLAGR